MSPPSHDPARRSRMGWKDVLARGSGSARILVVDDDVEIRRTLQRLLTRFGHTVRTAGSAEEADGLLSRERFDACLLDIQLPRMSGPEFLEWALNRDREMAVIMLTALDVPELAVECMQNGARTYLVKPVEADFLRLAVDDALAMHALLVERNDLAGRGTDWTHGRG